jgi:hypothetical protein
MKQLMDFSVMFMRWGGPFTRFPKGVGHYDYDNGGVWVAGYGLPEEMSGVVVALSLKNRNELQFEPGGVYTKDDRKIFLKAPLALERGDRVIHKTLEYLVTERIPYTEHAGFDVFIIKRVDTKGRDLIV